MIDICCIGHITLDKVVTPSSEKFMAGGTAFYFSQAMKHLPVDYSLLTSVAKTEMHFADALIQQGIAVTTFESATTVQFENIYGDNPDERTQRVPAKADPFNTSQVKDIDAAIIHLGPLLADDMPVDLVKALATKAKVSLDVQGYLRRLSGVAVELHIWADQQTVLPFIHFLKANEKEMEMMTGETDFYAGAKKLKQQGVKEVIITLGSKGALIFDGDNFYHIPAYTPNAVTDATGCGDTFMAGYLYMRCRNNDIQQSAEFAAAMASVKLSNFGPFSGTVDDVLNFKATALINEQSFRG